MSRILKTVTPTLLILIYFVSTMGFAIHTCSESGESETILPFEENHCNHHNSDNGCCSTTVYKLDYSIEDQKAEYLQVNINLIKDFSLFVIQSFKLENLVDSYQPFSKVLKIPLNILHSSNSFLAIWRL